MPGVSMTIMLGQYLYSMRMLISLASKHLEGSLSSRLFSDSIYAYEVGVGGKEKEVKKE